MPETYTKEQIDEAVRILKIAVGYFSDYGPEYEKSIGIILSVLSNAEQERDALLEMLDKSSGAIDISRIWCDRCAQVSRAEKAERERDALKAQVAELEARLQGAADRAVEWVDKTFGGLEYWDGVEGDISDEAIRAAIVGKKKE